MRTRHGRRIATLFGLSALAVLALPVRAMPPPLVYIEATLVEVDRTEAVEFGLSSLRARQRPSEQQAQDGASALGEVNSGLSELISAIEGDDDVGSTPQGIAAQARFGEAIVLNDTAIDRFSNRSRVARIRSALSQSHYTQIAGAAALHGQDQRFSDNPRRRIQQVRSNYRTFERFASLYDDQLGAHAPVDYYEPFDGLTRGNFLSRARLGSGGSLDVLLGGRRNKYLEFRGQTDEPASGFVTPPYSMGPEFTVAAEFSAAGRSRRALQRANGLTMVLEIDRPSDGAFWFVGFQYGADGIQQAFTADESGILDTVQINAPDLIRHTVTAIATLDGETLVLGGLFREKGRNGGTRQVLLGDIPVVGELFKAGAGAQGATRSRRGRADHLVFITPRVVRDTE